MLSQDGKPPWGALPQARYLLRLSVPQSRGRSKKAWRLWGQSWPELTEGGNRMVEGTWAVFSVGCLGGVLCELLHWWNLRTKPEWPAYAKWRTYWVLTLI